MPKTKRRGKVDYNADENHVSRRKKLPADVKETLLESTRSDWSKHPRFNGKANFFMTIHRDLINGSSHLRDGLEKLLDEAASNLSAALAQSRLLPYSRQLISFAHHHHEIEDHGYFPQFALLYPKLDRALALLDGDHKVLDEALHETDIAMRALNGIRPVRDDIAGLYKGSMALEKIMKRHIWDEEEIIIPIFLKHA